LENRLRASASGRRRPLTTGASGAFPTRHGFLLLHLSTYSGVPRDVHVSSPIPGRASPKSAGLNCRANLIAFIAKFAFLQPAGRPSAQNKRRCLRNSRYCRPKPKGELQQKRRTLFLLLRDFPNHIFLAENQCSIGHFVSLEPTRRNQGEWHEGFGQGSCAGVVGGDNGIRKQRARGLP